MRLERIVARGFRNLDDIERAVPPEGVAMLGRNGQGKTNLLEALYYPVLFRSLRGAGDADVSRFGGPGFNVTASICDQGRHDIGSVYQVSGRRKRITLDGAELLRLEALGRWLAVAFLPSDVALAGGPASERRHYLDRMLALADRSYLAALSRYRGALAQRNSALRQGRGEMADAFDGPLAQAGAVLVRRRMAWLGPADEQFSSELAGLGETGTGRLTYRGKPELADPAGWTSALDDARVRDRARCLTTVGPHRDDLMLEVDGRELRAFGSTGQQRSAAIALKLIEIETLTAGRGVQPALLLDDVFAELDGGRQRRLAARLVQPAVRQVFLTAPRPDELPAAVSLPVWTVESGKVSER